MIKSSKGEAAIGHPIGNPVATYPIEYKSQEQQASSMMIKEKKGLQSSSSTIIFNTRYL